MERSSSSEVQQSSRLSTGLGAFTECPRCRFPMVPAKGFQLSDVGSSMVASGQTWLEWLMGLGWNHLWFMAKPKRWWDRAFTNTPFTWLDHRIRRAKLARAQSEIAMNPHSLICPNCMHLEKR